MRTRFLVPLVICVQLSLASRASGSCGSSSCPIDLHALSLTSTTPFVVDLSFQYIDQDELRSGTHGGSYDGVETEHQELRTINRLTTIQFSYLASPRLQLGVVAPFVSRSHQHIASDSGELESWNFSSFGDAAIQARFKAFDAPATNESSVWISAAVKFPTGSTNEVSDGPDPERAEVTIQPGTGSVDALLGLTYEGGFIRNTRLPGATGNATRIPWFVSLSFRRNGTGTYDYRRGDELQLNLGSEYPLSPRFHLVGQLNLRNQAKDDVGTTGENRDLTGGMYVFVSPGIRVLVHAGMSAYGYVQLPLHQDVNGTQLVSRANYLAGIQTRF